jgi:hypothetical protein
MLHLLRIAITAQLPHVHLALAYRTCVPIATRESRFRPLIEKQNYEVSAISRFISNSPHWP